MAGGIERKLLTALLLAAALALSVGLFVRSAPEPPPRTTFRLFENLVPLLRDAEYVRTTRRLNLGSERGRRQSVEADVQLGADCSGLLTRPGGGTDQAWLLGSRSSFDVDVVWPERRSLMLYIASGIDAPQAVTVSFNGQVLGRKPLRPDGRPMPVLHEVPAELQRVGRNRVDLDFDATQLRAVEGVSQPLPVAGRVLTLRFLPPEEEAVFTTPPPDAPRDPNVERDFDQSAGHLVTRVVLPADSLVSLALELPPCRVALHLVVVELQLPLELAVARDGGRREALLSLDPGAPAGVVYTDLSQYSGEIVRLELRTAAGPPAPSPDGAVAAAAQAVLEGLTLLVPEGEELPPPTEGRFELLAEQPAVLAWTRGALRLEVDLARRQPRLYDLVTDGGHQVDVLRDRMASGALLLRELSRHVRDEHGEQPWWDGLMQWQRRE